MNDLPEGWERSTVDELLANGFFSDGDWVESKDQDPDGSIRLLQLADIGEGYFRNRSSRFINDEAAARLKVKFVDPGDVLVARMPDPIGRACLAPRLNQRAITVVDVCILRPDQAIEPQWLMWTLNAPSTRQSIAALATGTTRKRISRKNLATIRLDVPPLPEQRRIIAAIDEHFSRLDAAEASLIDALNRTDSFVASHLNAAFEQLDERVPLGELADVSGGIQKQPKRRPAENAFPFLRVANVKRNQLELDDVHEIELFGDEIDRYRLKAGDLLVVEGNGSPEQIGRSAVWGDEIANCVHQNHLIRVRPGPSLDAKFLNVFWNSSANARQLASVASSTSGLYTLSTSKLKRVLVPVTDVDEQQRIADELSDVFEKADRIRSELAIAQQRSIALRRAVLAAACSGRLVPQDPSDEPASLLLERIAADGASAKPSRRKKAAS